MMGNLMLRKIPFCFRDLPHLTDISNNHVRVFLLGSLLSVAVSFAGCSAAKVQVSGREKKSNTALLGQHNFEFQFLEPCLHTACKHIQTKNVA